MTNRITHQDIEGAKTWRQRGGAWSHQEMQEMLANAPHPCPLTALCDCHRWPRPSPADHQFVADCGERLRWRLAEALP